jgi:acyl-CoA hydrolase
MSLKNWKEEYSKKIVTYAEAAKQVRSGDLVCVPLGTGSCSNSM